MDENSVKPAFEARVLALAKRSDFPFIQEIEEFRSKGSLRKRIVIHCPTNIVQ